MIDRRTLEAAIDLYSDPKFVVIDLSPELRTLVEAARERLAQLENPTVLLADISDAALQEEWVSRVTKGSSEGTVRISYIGPDQPPVYIDDDPYRHWGEDV